ncbi:MAG TPA: complex I NDUFA9 subunit family protein [Thermohalobaculum sp.]|nr:complex I NDUFA9 subunit family protein [Thermohalobaculum sp.]
MVMPMSNAPLVTVVGGSGFVGRYVAQAMARRGWMVRVGCRRPNDAPFVMTYGTPGQVMPVQCNIRDEFSTRAAIRGSDAVVNCVGVLAPSGKNTFAAVQAEGAARVARIAAEEGARRLVQISAIGAAEDSPGEYGRTKAAGEKAVREAFADAVILRPSIIFGNEDRFFNRFASIAMLSPVVPVVGGSTRFQPVWVVDVASAAAKAAAGEVPAGVYELGGPTVYTFRELMELMLKAIRRRRFIVDIPLPVARLQARLMRWLPSPPLTEDQVAMLGRDNVVAEGAQGFEAFGIRPSAPEAIVESYLVGYRPYGQYNVLTEDRREDRFS